MKLTKKLLIVALMASLLVPAPAMFRSYAPHSEITFLADGGSDTSDGYEDHNYTPTRPNSSRPVKAA